VVTVTITAEVLDPQALGAAVGHPGAGAMVVFSGVVRDHEGDRSVQHLHYEAYQSLAQRRLESLARSALKRWPEARIAVAHRTGKLVVGEASVIVAVATAHRAEAFECCRSLMDEIKVGVPIWKKSFGPDGERWVDGETYVEKPEPE
jgi:molybdopterin synthase catalytic subunit